MTALMLGMSNPQPGREQDYADWYVSRHLPDVLRVPGVTGGEFYGRVNAASKTPWAHCGIYELDRPVGEVLAGIGSRVGTDEMPMTDSIDRSSTLFLSATAISPRIEAAKPSGPVFLTLVLANAVAGQDEAYNAYYSERHVSDVLAVPGMLAAQRFEIAPETGGKPSPWRYMAFFELEADRLSEVQAEIAARSGGPKMPDSPSIDRATQYVELFRRLS